MRKRNSQQPVLHYLFELGIFLKFLNGLLEVVGGVFLFLSTPQSLSKLAAKLLTNELLEDPRGLVANTLLHAAQRLSANAQVFASVYLLVHGIVKVGLVIGVVEKEAAGIPSRESSGFSSPCIRCTFSSSRGHSFRYS